MPSAELIDNMGVYLAASTSSLQACGQEDLSTAT